MIAPTASTKIITAWQTTIQSNWNTYFKQASALKLDSKLGVLIAVSILPIYPEDSTKTSQFKKKLEKLSKGKELTASAERFFKKYPTHKPLTSLVKHWLREARTNQAMRHAVEGMIIELKLLEQIETTNEQQQKFISSLLSDLWRQVDEPSAVRVLADQINAGQNIAIAGRDANIVIQTYSGNRSHLLSYLGSIRADWDHPELNRILPGYSRYADAALRLHRLFTSIDVWRNRDYETASDEKLMELRFKAAEKELREYRRPVLELIAARPHLVITGAAGTGKSYLARYIAVCLAYACEPEAEKRDKVNGLELLGESWLHGAILPFHVTLRDFAAHPLFPTTPEKASAEHLLKYLIEQTGSFGKEIEAYLTGSSSSGNYYTSILILDGLDELYSQSDRLVLQHTIENWADRFPLCRVLVTSRSYAYRSGAKWRLSSRFASAELAPFTKPQMKDYINNWYRLASLTRPSSFGGKRAAKKTTRQLAADLCKKVDTEESLIPLMRQPLLLALLTLIHETNKHLPEMRAELYETTIYLLNRWNPISEDEHFAEKLKNLKQNQLMNALKLAAFEMQKNQSNFQKHPNTIHRSRLKYFLQLQDETPEGIGAEIDDILDYLGTRNGTLLSDKADYFRFPHLSIQEYLAACALMELYDECPMPEKLKSIQNAYWTYPENLVSLLSDNPYRWRNVALLVGSASATNTGQDGRWNLIEELIPGKIKTPLTEAEVFRIYVAAEIWYLEWLKPRHPSHKVIRDNLQRAIKLIRTDERLDAPEKYRANLILARIQSFVTDS